MAVSTLHESMLRDPAAFKAALDITEALIPQVGPRGGPMSLLNARDVFLGDDSMLVVNQQELAAWYKGLRDSATTFNASGNTGTYDKCHVFVVGDSKVEMSDPTNTIIQDYAEWIGMGQTLTFPYTSGGQNSYWLNNTSITSVLGSGAWPKCKLLIIDIGTNERVQSAEGGAQTLAQTEANLMSFITKVRDIGNGGRSRDNLSIVIMGQTPGNVELSSHLQNEVSIRELDTILRRVAKTTNSVFVDQRGQFPRPHYDADWMDNLGISYGYASVHPMYTMAVVRQQVLLNILFPEAAVMRWKVPVYQNLTMLAGWTKFTDGQAARAIKVKDRVFMEGLIQPGTLTAGTAVANFGTPTGWIPKAHKFGVSPSSSTTSTNYYISSSGDVIISAAWPSGGYLSLSGMNYRTTGAILS